MAHRSRAFLLPPPPTALPLEHSILSGLGLDAIPQVSLGTAALVIFAACAIVAALRGLARLVLGTAILAAASLTGLWAWCHAPAIAGVWFPNPPGWFAITLTAVTALATFFLLRVVVRTVARPVPPADSGVSPGIVPRALRVLCSLVPAAILCFLGATLIRHAGSVADLRNFALTQVGVDTGSVPSFLSRLKLSLDQSLPSAWFRLIDPLTDDARLALAKWITARAGGDPRAPAIDPATGQPIPRAVIVDDPQLQDLARRGRFSEILRDPRLDAALADPQIRRTILDKLPR